MAIKKFLQLHHEDNKRERIMDEVSVCEMGILSVSVEHSEVSVAFRTLKKFN